MYKEINEYLDNNLIGTDTRIDNNAFVNAPAIKNPIILYRGLNLPNIKSSRGRNALLLGQYKGQYKGFLSTSLDEFSSKMFTFNSCCVFKIIIPPGTKCLFIESISDFNLEQEVLLPRNSIISISYFTDGTINAELKLQTVENHKPKKS
jgi:hypothetical protein